MNSTCRRKLMDNDGKGNKKVYVKVIDNLYVIVCDGRR